MNPEFDLEARLDSASQYCSRGIDESDIRGPSHLSWSWNQVLFPLQNENQDPESLESCPATGSHLLHKGRSIWALAQSLGFYTEAIFRIRSWDNALRCGATMSKICGGRDWSREWSRGAVIQGKLPSLHCQSGFLEASASAVAPRLLAFSLKTAFACLVSLKVRFRGQSVVWLVTMEILRGPGKSMDKSNGNCSHSTACRNWKGKANKKTRAGLGC